LLSNHKSKTYTTPSTNRMSASKDNEQHEELPPDTPEMRSVLIRSTPAFARPLSLGQLPKMPRSFAKAAPVAPVISKSSPVKTWKPDSIPKLPEMYQLGRSRVTISNCDGCEITSRIGECLRQQPLSVTFEESTAVCETACHTKFIVKIFEDDKQFIVEVQRRTGCSFVCQKFCRAILRAAKVTKAAPLKPRTFAIPASIPRKDDEREKAVDEDVKNAISLIEQKKVDVQVLGVSALISLTAKNKIKVQDSILQFLSKHISSRPPGGANRCRLRLDALTVFANLLTKNSLKCSFVIENNLLQPLVTDLTHDDLLLAYQAARCMTSICRQYPQLKDNITELGVSIAVEQAKQQGQARHKLLEDQVQLLKLELER